MFLLSAQVEIKKQNGMFQIGNTRNATAPLALQWKKRDCFLFFFFNMKTGENRCDVSWSRSCVDFRPRVSMATVKIVVSYTDTFSKPSFAFIKITREVGEHLRNNKRSVIELVIIKAGHAIRGPRGSNPARQKKVFPGFQCTVASQ